MASVFDSYDFIDKVYLFGSYVKSKANSNSDIDLVVKFKDKVGMKLYSLYDAIKNVLNKRPDILTENEIMKNMSKSYERDRVLYMKDSIKAPLREPTLTT